MKKLKYAFWLILIALFAILVYQNLPYFTAKHSLHIDLGVYENGTPDLANGAIIAIFVGISVLIMMIFYFGSRYESYRAKKALKELKNVIDESTTTIAQLKEEVELLKSGDSMALEGTSDDAPEAQNGQSEAEIEQPTQA